AAYRDPEPAAAVGLPAGTRWRHPRKGARPVGEIRPADRTLARRAASEAQQSAQPSRDDDAAYHAANARVSFVRPATAVPPQPHRRCERPPSGTVGLFRVHGWLRRVPVPRAHSEAAEGLNIF